MTTWNLTGTQQHILICNGSSCMRKGGEDVTQAIREEISKQELDLSFHTTRTRCNGRCKDACVVIVYPEGTWYRGMTPELGRNLVANCFKKESGFKDAMIYEYGDGIFNQVKSSQSINGISKTGGRKR